MLYTFLYYYFSYVQKVILISLCVIPSLQLISRTTVQRCQSVFVFVQVSLPHTETLQTYAFVLPSSWYYLTPSVFCDFTVLVTRFFHILQYVIIYNWNVSSAFISLDTHFLYVARRRAVCEKRQELRITARNVLTMNGGELSVLCLWHKLLKNWDIPALAFGEYDRWLLSAVVKTSEYSYLSRRKNWGKL